MAIKGGSHMPDGIHEPASWDDAEHWNKEYGEGAWEHLKDASEVAHYALQAALISHFEATDSVLDIGCGEGLLQKHLLAVGYKRYLGLDLSQVAIDRAKARADKHTQFMVADASRFSTQKQFSAIVFSESLYYFREPHTILGRYQQRLLEDGVIIVSAFVLPSTERLLEDILARFQALEDMVVTNARGAWRCLAIASSAGRRQSQR
jgi:predicted TPR repeat methyltransferase